MADISTRGPQVTARPGSKRWHKQVRLRRTFLAISESSARAEAKRAADRADRALAELEAARARTAAAEAELDTFLILATAILPSAGNA